MSRRTLILLPFIWIACGQTNCPQDLNKLPMYGHVKKCKQQLASDREFIDEVSKEFKNRNDAAKYFVARGWDYFNKNKTDTAMMRFNQAWLLDSLNADIYWGFGNILGKNNKLLESLKYFDTSLRLNPGNPIVWECASTSYSLLFFELHDIRLLDTSIKYIKRSIRLDPNPRTYAELTAAYSYSSQKDSARKYLGITDKMDPKAIVPGLRKSLE
jgi:tetratricopeptide (TPR) repeat protein